MSEPGKPQAMTLAEKALYHQIHPAKLATDILSGLISLVLFWRHWLWIGLAVHFLPAIAASSLIIAFVDIGPLKRSRLGGYLTRHMGPGAQAARLGGDLVMVAGAWLHTPWVIGFGLIVVVGAWMQGRLAESTRDPAP